MNRACLGPQIRLVFHRAIILTRPASAATSNLAPAAARERGLFAPLGLADPALDKRLH